ncbi:hypothetical protein J6590_071205 [Homalodisca vitripennis]|nr:hypothetical protein J6590_071205 [Homalodisca vitripennis]
MDCCRIKIRKQRLIKRTVALDNGRGDNSEPGTGTQLDISTCVERVWTLRGKRKLYRLVGKHALSEVCKALPRATFLCNYQELVKHEANLSGKHGRSVAENLIDSSNSGPVRPVGRREWVDYAFKFGLVEDNRLYFLECLARELHTKRVCAA